MHFNSHLAPSQAIESPLKVALRKNTLKIKPAKTKQIKEDKENVNVNLKKKIGAPNLKTFGAE